MALTCAPGEGLAPTAAAALPSPAQPGTSWAFEGALMPATLTQAQPQTAVIVWCQRARATPHQPTPANTLHGG